MTEKRSYDALKLSRQLCFPLYAAARKTVALYTPYLKPLGITYTQYLVFLVLWETDGLSVGELGEKLRLDTGTLTPVLKRMADQGFVSRVRSRGDERVVLVELTKKGWALQETARDIPHRVGACLPLSEEEVKTLYGLLYRVIESL